MNPKLALERIKKEESRLARKKKSLEEKLKASQQESQKIEKLVASSGYSSPKKLIKAIADHYGIGGGASKGGRRTRTPVTTKLRDEVKKRLKDAKSALALSREMGLSYAVVQKIAKGQYDKLKD